MRQADHSVYTSLRMFLDKVPVIDTHEHYFATTNTQPIEAMALLDNSFYTHGDLCSVSSESAAIFKDLTLTAENQFGEFYEQFDQAYRKCRHTAYFKGSVRGAQECWGLKTVNRQSMMALQAQIGERNNEFYQRMMEKYRIKVKIVDTCSPQRIHQLIKTGRIEGFSSYCRFAFPLASFHNFFVDGRGVVDMLSDLTGMPVPDLDAFSDAFKTLVQQSIEAGVVCFKDQSAYNRLIRYDQTPREQADLLYAKLLSQGNLDYNDSIALSNWVMRFAMTQAGKYKLPVQMHTGHMAGLYNEISKANAVHLTSLIADFPDVHFDLFHGNWPYMGEYLFLGKNYPNVSLDLCWVQSIDCDYSIELMKRVVMTLPHSKLLAYGGDCCMIEGTIGFLCQARDNAAVALSSLVESSWLTLDDAKEIACDWFFNNANSIFRLGMEPCDWQNIEDCG